MSETQKSIKVTQEKLPSSQVSLEIEIPPEQSRKAYEQVVTKTMRTAQIPGFRKGKVPRQVVLKRFGANHLKASALEELIQNTLEAAIKQEEIEALGNLKLRSPLEDLVAQYQPGEPLTFTASVDVLPVVTLKKHQDLQISVEKVNYNPEQVDQALEEHRLSEATLVPVEDRPAQRNDEALIDLVGKFAPEDGEDADSDDQSDLSDRTIAGSTVTDFKMDLSDSSRFLPGLVEGIIGMTVDETKDIAISFPQDYAQEDLAGKSTIFTVTLKDIKAKELPDLDDDFAQAVSEFSTLDELRQFLEEQYQQQAQDQTDANIETALLEALLENCDVDPPETLVQEEVDFLIKETVMRLQSQGLDVNQLITKDSLPQFRERLRPEAVTRVKRTLALAEVAQTESIQVDPDALEKRVQEVTSELSDRKVDPERVRGFLEEELLKEEVMTWLKDHAHIKFVETKSTEEEAIAQQNSTKSGTDTEAVMDVSAETVTEEDLNEAVVDSVTAAADPSEETPTPASKDSTASGTDPSDPSPQQGTKTTPKSKTASKSKTAKAETKTSKATSKSKTAKTASATKTAKKTAKSPPKPTSDGTKGD